MVKIIAVIAIATGCFAGPAADAAIKIVGSADSKIEKLFSRDGDYIDINGNIDISKVSETLKINYKIDENELSKISKISDDISDKSLSIIKFVAKAKLSRRRKIFITI